MFAATAAGIYDKVEDAMQAMGQGFDAEYYPNAERAAIYAKRYQQYKNFGAYIEAQTENAQDEKKVTQEKLVATA